MDKPSSPEAKALLEWYDRHARSMPWRVPPEVRKSGVKPNPYHVWLSEVMLQQTQVATVQEYFQKFVAKWPTIEDLANADIEDVMKAWAGLGYYSRARNLKKCADQVAFELSGKFPQTSFDLQALPGIGAYTSAAIASIAFDEPVAVVDGNVERVFSRLSSDDKPLPKLKENIRALVGGLLDHSRPGDFAQATMDLGATLCSPKNPACSLCPLNNKCKAFAAGTQEQFPVKAPRKLKPTRIGAVFIIQREDGAIWLQKRAESGLLGGMSEVPTTDWDSRKDGATGEKAAPFASQWSFKGTARHTFTHFHLELEVWIAGATKENGDGWWSIPSELAGEALPTVMKKAIEVALPGATKR